MIEPELAESLVHRRHTVMWRRLRPLTFRRYVALLIANSPLLDPSRDVTWDDLEVAVTICCMRDPIRGHVYITRRFAWRGRILRLLRGGSLPEHVLRFLAYVADYHAPPATSEILGGKPAKASWVLRMIETFRRNRYTEQEAWDLPSGEAFHRYITLVELDGGELEGVLDPEEKELLELAQKARAARDSKAAPLTAEGT